MCRSTFMASAFGSTSCRGNETYSRSSRAEALVRQMRRDVAETRDILDLGAVSGSPWLEHPGP